MSQPFADAMNWVPKSRALAQTLTRAHDFARAHGHVTVGLEHLLLSLVEDQDAAGVLAVSGIELEALSGDVTAHLASLATEDGSIPVADEALLRILEYAVAAAQQSKRRDVNGGIVLAAIVGEGKSEAAGILRHHGMTFQAAIEAIKSSSRPAPVAAAVPLPVHAPVVRAAPAGLAPGMGADEINDAATTATEVMLARARQRVGALQNPVPVPIWSPQPVPDEAPEPPPVVEQSPPEDSDAAPPDEAVVGGDAVMAAAAAAAPVIAAAVPAPIPEPPAAEIAMPSPVPDAAPAAPPRPSPSWLPPSPPGAAAAASRAPVRVPPPIPPLTPGSGPPPLPVAANDGNANGNGNGHGHAAAADVSWSDAARSGRSASLSELPSARRLGRAASEDNSGGRRRARDAGSQSDVQENAIRRLLSGRLLAARPKLRIGKTAAVEVHVPWPDIMMAAGGKAAANGAAVSLWLHVVSGSVHVASTSPETVWIGAADAVRLQDQQAAWTWTVEPLKRGRVVLHLEGAVRALGRDGFGAEMTLPGESVEMPVAANHLRTVRKVAVVSATAGAAAVLDDHAEPLLQATATVIQRLIGGG